MTRKYFWDPDARIMRYDDDEDIARDIQERDEEDQREWEWLRQEEERDQ